MTENEVEIVEVGPRDGLQNIAKYVPTAVKIDLIRQLAGAGFTRMEFGSFVSPKAIPQMKDMEAVLEGLPPMPGVTGMTLVPNSKGAQRALAAGVKDLIFVMSVSEPHNQSNVRRPTEASIADFKATLEEIDPLGELTIRVGLATCFHCPFDGVIDEDKVISTIEKIVPIREGMEYAISDTTGMATPAHVKSLTKRCIDTFGGSARFCFHGHDTAGFGIANVLAAMEGGIRSFDTSVAGLGGCPFAPGATGNIPSEDVVYLFQRLGVTTGIDLEKLLDAGTMILAESGAPMASHVRAIPRARLFADLLGIPPSRAVAA
ncbi:hydroxymethylglutaryl-CoA lyase [Acuticoccus yangtzensis]|uniref:hydroxymethylglutaryl-CoA lyase n=1 Tax=Acuticoccus yangtzensis TaxID=1443441 RepID=UPI0009498D57|nr:hydroxymethylglutaryl-CoA lyase [Acuticoccus yangtzensis]ORE90924.1 hydroxymethylglutaryl-CoA lyase [Stappia sp. 22II-S9-Z10]